MLGIWTTLPCRVKRSNRFLTWSTRDGNCKKMKKIRTKKSQVTISYNWYVTFPKASTGCSGKKSPSITGPHGWKSRKSFCNPTTSRKVSLYACSIVSVSLIQNMKVRQCHNLWHRYIGKFLHFSQTIHIAASTSSSFCKSPSIFHSIIPVSKR